MVWLVPSASSDLMFPPMTAFMSRTDLGQTRLLGYRPINLETLTTLLSGLLNGMPTVRHAAGATPDILASYAQAGLRVSEDQRLFSTEAEAFAQADRLVQEGYRLAFAYPLPEGRFPDPAQLVTSALWRQLNAKENLGLLTGPDHLMAREVLPLPAVRDTGFQGPVWIKAAGGAATGWGYAVRHCPDAQTFDRALADLAALDVQDLVIEQDADCEHCWCVSLGITEHSVTYLGFAEQVFTKPGSQAGSRIDPEHPFPVAGKDLACAMGRIAQGMGYRGVAGFDIGHARDGRLVVFDPNFRFNSSTPMAMLHDSAAARAGLPASLGFHHAVPGTCRDMLRKIGPAIDSGWFVPTRLLDASLLPAAEGQNLVTGFVLGTDTAAAEQSAEILRACLTA